MTIITRLGGLSPKQYLMKSYSSPIAETICKAYDNGLSQLLKSKDLRDFFENTELPPLSAFTLTAESKIHLLKDKIRQNQLNQATMDTYVRTWRKLNRIKSGQKVPWTKQEKLKRQLEESEKAIVNNMSTRGRYQRALHKLYINLLNPIEAVLN